VSDPKRWREGGDAPERVSELLKQARRSRSMTSPERARVTLRVDRIAALPAAVGLGLWLKGLAIAAGLAATGLAVARGPALWPEAAAPPAVPSGIASMAPRAQPAARDDAVAPVAPAGPGASTGPGVAQPAGDAAAAAVDPGHGVAPSSPRAPAPASAPPASSAPEPAPDAATALEREAALLEDARALVASKPSEALVRLEQHAASFPGGKLGQERELLIVSTLSKLGRTAEARARGEALLARSRGGLYAERIRAILDSMP
jgi:hypothetical protein